MRLPRAVPDLAVDGRRRHCCMLDRGWRIHFRRRGCGLPTPGEPILPGLPLIDGGRPFASRIESAGEPKQSRLRYECRTDFA
jgi:hypothetical protein